MIARLRLRYATWSTEALRVGIRVYSAPILRLLFADALAGMEMELLARELPSIAADSGGFLVAPAEGLQ